MSVPQSFLENLENVRLVMSVALDHFQDNRDQFAKSATGVQVRQAEKSFCQVRVLTMQLESSGDAQFRFLSKSKLCSLSMTARTCDTLYERSRQYGEIPNAKTYFRSSGYDA
jgi:hypothetical protein